MKDQDLFILLIAIYGAQTMPDWGAAIAAIVFLVVAMINAFLERKK